MTGPFRARRTKIAGTYRDKGAGLRASVWSNGMVRLERRYRAVEGHPRVREGPGRCKGAVLIRFEPDVAGLP